MVDVGFISSVRESVKLKIGHGIRVDVVLRKKNKIQWSKGLQRGWCKTANCSNREGMIMSVYGQTKTTLGLRLLGRDKLTNLVLGVRHWEMK